MSVKFGFVIVVILSVFVAKLSIENLNSAQAQDFKSTSNTKSYSQQRIVKLK